MREEHKGVASKVLWAEECQPSGEKNTLVQTSATLPPIHQTGSCKTAPHQRNGIYIYTHESRVFRSVVATGFTNNRILPTEPWNIIIDLLLPRALGGFIGVFPDNG